MGRKFQTWIPLSQQVPRDLGELLALLLQNRQHHSVDRLVYGDHGLEQVVNCISAAIKANRRIALYADYDVDGTMSCVSWLWFFQAISYHNVIPYIPCRFKEGYGLNLGAVQHLIDDEGAELIITMDTGITANAEAAYCKERGVQFVCTDHHVIQPERMPDCIILNPKMHPDQDYRELCGCGITFVLLRRLASMFAVPAPLWNDLLALCGMATICDVVPLNSVNHRLAKMGVEALGKSQRPVLRRLLAAAMAGREGKAADEMDVGFRLGPRINAVGRLEHAELILKAFIDEDPEPLIAQMDACNEQRRLIQRHIVDEARVLAARQGDAPVLFLGGDWHQGVVGIAASKIAEEFWRPTWLFQRAKGADMPYCKGSARSIPGFDVTMAMVRAKQHFTKFGGHAAAGGFSFTPEAEPLLREALNAHALAQKNLYPEMWTSRKTFDCALPLSLANLSLATALAKLKPFGHGFEEPRFVIDAEVLGVDYYNDKKTGEPRHTAVRINGAGRASKVMYFNEVINDVTKGAEVRLLVTVQRDYWQGQETLSLMGQDIAY